MSRAIAFLKKYGLFTKRMSAISPSVRIFHHCHMQSNMNGFKSLFIGSPDEISSLLSHELDFPIYQQLLCLNIWVVGRRLSHERIEGNPEHNVDKEFGFLKSLYMSVRTRFKTRNKIEKIMQEIIFDLLWNDTEKRIRAIEGVHSLMVSKNLKEVQSYSMGGMITYDYAMQFMDTSIPARDQGETSKCRSILEAALYRNVFMSDDRYREESVVKLAQYVLEQLDSLYAQDIEEVRRGYIWWVDPPKDDRIMAHFKEKDYNELTWIPALTLAGDRYFYNVETGEIKKEKK